MNRLAGGRAAIEFIDSLGGVRFFSSSHPHGFGAIWQLEENFPGATIGFQREAVQFTKALRVNFVFDDVLAIDEAATLYHIGGHYECQSVLYYAPREILFCGDALKFDLDADGKTIAVICHKAFHKQIPLSKKEIENYLQVIGNLNFRQACTPFEHCKDATTADAVRLFEEQLASHRTSAAPMSLVRAQESNSE